jgi:hypothetical protein
VVPKNKERRSEGDRRIDRKIHCSATGERLVQSKYADIVVHAYIAAEKDDMDEMELEGDEQGQDEVMAATVLELPNSSLEGVWER